jgi:hypothetical protein
MYPKRQRRTHQSFADDGAPEENRRPIHPLAQVQTYTYPAAGTQTYPAAQAHTLPAGQGFPILHPQAHPRILTDPVQINSWAVLEAGVDRIMTRLRDGIDMKSYMELYTAVHNFCTSQKSMSTIHQGAGQGQRGGKLIPCGSLCMRLCENQDDADVD